MSEIERTLAAELRRIRDEQHALAVRAAHVETSLLRARQGEDAGIVLARLKAKGVLLEREPKGCPTPGWAADGGRGSEQTGAEGNTAAGDGRGADVQVSALAATTRETPASHLERPAARRTWRPRSSGRAKENRQG